MKLESFSVHRVSPFLFEFPECIIKILLHSFYINMGNNYLYMESDIRYKI